MKILIPLFLMLSFVGCKKSDSIATTRSANPSPEVNAITTASPGPVSTPHPTPQPELSLDEQARQQADKYVMKKYKQCGDSYYTRDPHAGGSYYEFKNGPQITVNGGTPQLSPAERLNSSQAGVEWDGQISVFFGLARQYTTTSDTWGNQGWTKWSDMRVPQSPIKMTKKNGHWYFSETDLSQFQKVDCSSVPK